MWDVVVIGGGPAGCSAALALRTQGARVLLIERRVRPTPHPGEMLTGDGVRCLEELGVAKAFRTLESRPCYLHRIHWAGGTIERPSLMTRQGPSINLDRESFDSMLLDECATRGVAVRRGVRLGDVDRLGGLFEIHLAEVGSTTQIRSPFLIDATGRSAYICRRLGARRERADRLVALSAVFERGDLEPSSLIESEEEGWWYSAPRPERTMTALYLTEFSAPRAGDMETIWRGAFERTPATSARLAGKRRRTGVRAYRAGPEWTEFDPSPPALPVGDAALSFDPIAGEGLCFALRSGIEAARAIWSSTLRRAYRDGAWGIYQGHLRDREAGYAQERAIRSSAFWHAPRDRTGLGSSPPRPFTSPQFLPF